MTTVYAKFFAPNGFLSVDNLNQICICSEENRLQICHLVITQNMFSAFAKMFVYGSNAFSNDSEDSQTQENLNHEIFINEDTGIEYKLVKIAGNVGIITTVTSSSGAKETIYQQEFDVHQWVKLAEAFKFCLLFISRDRQHFSKFGRILKRLCGLSNTRLATIFQDLKTGFGVELFDELISADEQDYFFNLTSKIDYIVSLVEVQKFLNEVHSGLQEDCNIDEQVLDLL